MPRPALCLAAAAAGFGAGRGLTLLSAGRDSVAHLAAPPAPKRIHVISVGRQGSCTALDLFERAGGGLPVLFEPLRAAVEGPEILSDPNGELRRKQVRCLFSEDAASQDCQGTFSKPIVSQEALGKLREVLASPRHPPLVMKTTRMINMRLMAEELSPEQLQGAKFVVLVRDPRAIWASFKPLVKSEGWAIHSVELVCRLLAESLLTVPALADAAPGRVEVAVYEEWSKDLARFAERMGSFFGLDGSGMVRLGRERQRQSGRERWVGDLTDAEVSEIERDRFCRAYMGRVGYSPGRARGGVYSGLRSSADLQRGLEPSEEGLLAELMSIREYEQPRPPPGSLGLPRSHPVPPPS